MRFSHLLRSFHFLQRKIPILKFIIPITIFTSTSLYISIIREYYSMKEMNIPYDVYKFSIKNLKILIEELLVLKRNNVNLESLLLQQVNLNNNFENNNLNNNLENNLEINNLQSTNLESILLENEMMKMLFKKYKNEIVKEIIKENDKDKIFINLFKIIDFVQISKEYNELYIDKNINIFNNYLFYENLITKYFTFKK
ncbi:hypothetical protein ABK040_010704 [Willaertia magna]